jgi:hypothetical protein
MNEQRLWITNGELSENTSYSHLNQHNLNVPIPNSIYLLELYLVNNEHIRPNLKLIIGAQLKHSLIPLLESEASKLQTVELILRKQLTICSAKSSCGKSMLNSVNIAAVTSWKVLPLLSAASLWIQNGRLECWECPIYRINVNTGRQVCLFIYLFINPSIDPCMGRVAHWM